MYRGFNISGISTETFGGLSFKDGSNIHNHLAQIGKEVGARYKNSIEDAIEVVERNGKVSFSGNEIEGLCFPHLDFDIFISHSHDDEQIALEFAGLMKNWFGINAFVDSCAWNYRDKIIQRIGRIVCNERSLTAKEYLDLYVSVASCVDCMLNKALIGMIDECECLFFLNTPNSIASSGLGSVTYSAWIYAELEASRVVERKVSRRRRQGVMECFAEDVSPFVMTFDVCLNHLTPVVARDIVDWGVGVCKSKKGFDALDALYEQFPEK